jgi:NitT/TauT family transport system permease protein
MAQEEEELVKTSPRGSPARRKRPAVPVWGESSAVIALYHSGVLADIAITLGILGFFYGLTQVSQEWTGILRPTVVIDLSLRSLPRYTFFSLIRGLAAYGVSLGFTIVYGYWAAKDRLAEKLLIPILDILQSIPVLGFMPGLVLALVSLFPASNTGLELACIVMIFTGQAWNMTFSFYNSLKSVPQYLQEAGTVYHFGWWQRLTQIEMPYSAVSLIWNSMMSMAGGWFFLMVTETFQLGSRDFRLPGIGSYMSVAVDSGDTKAMIGAVVAMILMIVALDQLLWHPLVVWAQKFRIEDTTQEEAMESSFLDLLRHSHILRGVGVIGASMLRTFRKSAVQAPPLSGAKGADNAASSDSAEHAQKHPVAGILISRLAFVLLAAGLVVALLQVVRLLASVSGAEWVHLVQSDLLTLARVTAALLLGTAWAVPLGIRIGLSPRLSRIMQPVVQVAASFPAPMLFPAVILILTSLNITIGVGSIVLMLLGTQWYILFNVIAGAQAIPSDLKEAAANYHFAPHQRFWSLYVPAVFPYLVTGWVTAAGGAWNASIVAETVTFRGSTLTARGIGAVISNAAFSARFGELSGAILIMALTVVLINRFVWRPLYTLASTRYNLSK